MIGVLTASTGTLIELASEFLNHWRHAESRLLRLPLYWAPPKRFSGLGYLEFKRHPVRLFQQIEPVTESCDRQELTSPNPTRQREALTFFCHSSQALRPPLTKTGLSQPAAAQALASTVPGQRTRVNPTKQRSVILVHTYGYCWPGSTLPLLAS